MTFSSNHYFFLLLLIPFLLIYLWIFRPQDIPEFRFSSIKRLAGIGNKTRAQTHSWTAGGLRLLTLILLIVVLARPQKGLQSEDMTARATDIMICLDASRSMESVDFKPKNRFEVAKEVISDFIKGRDFDRIGMVLFAEHAITQCPLTLDKSALLNILDVLRIGVIPPNQTAIGVGLATSVNRLKSSKAKSKVIILVTDGSNNAGTIDPFTAAKTAAAHNIRIYSIGAGSPEGGLMPIDDPIFGKRMIKTGSDLDEDTLLRIASETDGQYFRAKTSQSLKTIFQEIDSLEKTDIKVKEYVDYEERYIGFLLAALLLLFLELFLTKTVLRTVP